MVNLQSKLLNLQLPTFYLNLIKVLSTILISGAIIWELYNLYLNFIGLKISDGFQGIFWVERFAVTAHVIEGIIAGYYAVLNDKNPLKYGIYTFFVGTVGLLELKSQKLE
ncbi:MAG TPA: hypothetical protein DCF68_14975 [Cyanothece sp. UBA12306]|nr:hypothetical protein [Cyanothece sp. UBA12306]